MITPGSRRRTTRKRVLLVEDDLVIRDLVDDVLAQTGYDVIPATTGKQALDYLEAEATPPDVVILDLMVPLVSGWQVLEKMRSDDRFSGIPVIVTTAVSADRPPGATMVLKKPFSVRALLEAIVGITGGAPDTSPPTSPGG
jgi:DNA-binding response OmpR family regulator